MLIKFTLPFQVIVSYSNKFCKIPSAKASLGKSKKCPITTYMTLLLAYSLEKTGRKLRKSFKKKLTGQGAGLCCIKNRSKTREATCITI